MSNNETFSSLAKELYKANIKASSFVNEEEKKAVVGFIIPKIQIMLK